MSGETANPNHKFKKCDDFAYNMIQHPIGSRKSSQYFSVSAGKEIYKVPFFLKKCSAELLEKHHVQN